MRKAWAFLLIPALFFLPGKAAVFSQEAKPATFSSLEQTLYQGEMKTISVNMPNRVIIGKPEIADILSVSAKEIVVVGKGPGMTNLIWWDEKGEHHASIKVLAEAMGYINSRIRELIKELNLPQISTQPSDSEGKVLLLGSVKTKEDMERIRTALGGLFLKTTNLIQIEEEKAIIELEVEIIEVDKGSTKSMGMDWLLSGGNPEFIEPGRWSTLGDIPDSLFRISEWTHEALRATLNLMVQEGKARILSRPKLACQSGKEAELMVGGEKPVMTTQTVSGGGSSNSVDYKEYGIKLKMAPALNADGKIKLGLNVEVSDIGTAEVLGLATQPTAKAWPLTKRSTSTQLYLNNGQTLAISGLIKQKTEEQMKKFPWLGDVPILGVFFRNRSTIKGSGIDTLGDTELVIMVTPSIVEDKGLKKPETEKKSQVKPGAGKIGDSKAKSGKKTKAAKTPQAYTPERNKGVVVSKGKSSVGGKKEPPAAKAEDRENTGVVVTPGKTFAKVKPKASSRVLAGDSARKDQAASDSPSTKSKVSSGKYSAGVSPKAVPQSGEGDLAWQADEVPDSQDGEAAVSSGKYSAGVSPKAVPQSGEGDLTWQADEAPDSQDAEAAVSSGKTFGGIRPKAVFRGPAGDYIRQVIEYLSDNISYPWAAKQAELEGTVIINLHLARAGDLLESNVGDSSGFSILDENSMSTARRIAPYPAFPRDMSGQDIWLQIPIFYNLQEKR